MKKFTVPCSFGSKKAPFDVYIGMPGADCHPLEYQALWLEENRGGAIPPEVMESFSKLLALSLKNNVSFEDLCVYALEAANEEKKRQAEGENLTIAPPEDIAKAQQLLGMGTISVLADAQQLNRFFDDAFNLLYVVCRSSNGTPSQAILLCEEKYVEKLSQAVAQSKLTVEQLLDYGEVEYIGPGITLPTEIMSAIRKKYE